MVPKELKRLYPNAKPEHIEMALERFGEYKCDEGESEIELFGNNVPQQKIKKIKRALWLSFILFGGTYEPNAGVVHF